jgi:glycosyltransferase involved in cell wall biosynthesis
MKIDNILAVCMPAYNAEKNIASSIDSILSQSYKNFKFIITDDCSTDGTVQIIKSYNDPSIIFMQNSNNLGTVQTRNNMLDYCIDNNFTFMALMDADDIAFPNRLKKQIEILEKDTSIAICGSSMKMERTKNIWVANQNPSSIKVECLFGKPIPTPSATIRLQYMIKYNLRWDKYFAPCADYHLWYLMLYKYNLKAKNTGNIDMIYSHSENGVSYGKGLIKQEMKDAEIKQLILKYFSIKAKFEDVFSFMKVALCIRIDAQDASAI